MEDEKTINPNQYENDDVGLPEDPDGGGGLLTLVELEIAHSVDGPADTQAAPGDQRAVRRHGNLGYAPSELVWPTLNLTATGTMTGLGTYFKDAKPDVYRIG